VIRVKARTDLKLEPILRRGGRIVVRGRLFDRASDEGVGGARVWVYFDRNRRTTLTDTSGRFDLRVPAPPGSHDLVVMFSGDAHHAPASVEIHGFDPSKNPLTLSLDLLKEVPYPPHDLRAHVTAKSNDTPVALPLTAVVSQSMSTGVDIPPQALPAVTTNDKGEASIPLPGTALGKPGRKLIEVRFKGDGSYDAARARAEVLLVTATALTAELDDDDVAFESSVELSGKLVDNAGGGVPLGRIVVFANGKRVADTVTRGDGSWDANVSAKQIGAGKRKLDVRFEPARSWRKASAAKPLSIAVGEPKPMPVGYTLAAFGATALILLAFIGLRAKPWHNWAWLHRDDDDDSDRDDDANERPPVHTGLAVARPSLVSTLRRAADHGVSGVVRDAVSGRPLAGARIEMIDTGDGAATTDSARDGSFVIEDLNAGHWRATVRCNGYCSERFGVSLPHRGELRGVRVDLLPVRERIFELYQTVAQPLLPESGQWGIWTPRQIVDHVRASQPRPALAQLTDFVEEAYFSQRTPDEDILQQARELVRTARIEAER